MTKTYTLDFNRSLLTLEDAGAANARFIAMLGALGMDNGDPLPATLPDACIAEIHQMARQVAGQLGEVILSGVSNVAEISPARASAIAEQAACTQADNIVALVTAHLESFLAVGASVDAVAGYYSNLFLDLHINSRRASITLNTPGPDGSKTVRNLKVRSVRSMA